MNIGLFLDGRQVNDAKRTNRGDVVRIRDTGLLHGLTGALDRAADTGFPDEHVVRLLGQHEPAGARQWIEAGLRQSFKLHLAVTVGEIGEHEERQPVGRCFVERSQHARMVFGTRLTLQQHVGFLATVGTEVFLQQIHHGPQMAAFFHVHLEQVAHVVKRRRGLAQMALLFNRGRFRIALDHDQAAQHGAVFAGHFLPYRLAGMFAARDGAAFFFRCQQDAPAIFRHSHITELGPSLGINRNCGPQIHQ